VIDNIKRHLREIEFGGMDWINLAQDRGTVQGFCEYGNKYRSLHQHILEYQTKNKYP
jgi:hypothetical protein